MSQKQKLSAALAEAGLNLDNLNWSQISIKQNLTPEFLQEFHNYIFWGIFVRHQTISLEILDYLEQTNVPIDINELFCAPKVLDEVRFKILDTPKYRKMLTWKEILYTEFSPEVLRQVFLYLEIDSNIYYTLICNQPISEEFVIQNMEHWPESLTLGTIYDLCEDRGWNFHRIQDAYQMLELLKE